MYCRREMYIRIIVTFLFFLFIFCLSYFLYFIKFDNRECLENEVLRIQNNILKEKLYNVEQLRNNSDDYVIGKVLVRDLYNFYDELIIDLGEKDGIKEGDAVLNEDGLIGIVYKTLKERSFVKLLTSDYNVSVIIGDFFGNLNSGKVTLLDKYSEIEPGDCIYTSGYGEIEKGIFIGTVESVDYDKYSLGKEVVVSLIDNKMLSYILVLKS